MQSKLASEQEAVNKAKAELEKERQDRLATVADLEVQRARVASVVAPDPSIFLLFLHLNL